MFHVEAPPWKCVEISWWHGWLASCLRPVLGGEGLVNEMARTRTELMVELSFNSKLQILQAACWFSIGDPGQVSEVLGLS
jgi:hypothetical protein